MGLETLWTRELTEEGKRMQYNTTRYKIVGLVFDSE